MAERYQTIYKQGAMYQDDCPLIILASALLRDTATGRMIVQLKLQNVGQNNISAVFVDIECRNVANEDVGSRAFQYLDLQVKPQGIFGTQIPIELPDDTTRYYSVSVSRIVLDNGQIWENTGRCVTNPLVIETIVSKQYPKELAEQFIRDSGINAAEIYYPQQVSNLRICACGTVYENALAACPHCGYTFEQLQHMLDKAVLQKNRDAHTENERTKTEQQQAQQEARAKKTKKTLAIIVPSVVVIIAFVFLLTRFIMPAGHYKRGEALLAVGDSFGAAQEYLSVGDLKKARNAWDFDSMLFAHMSRTVGLRMNGTVLAVGENEDGRCDVQNWRDITAVSVGNWHTVALRVDGTVVAVGANGYGQCNVNNWFDVIAISAGVFHTVGLKADGTVVAVGRNGDGQCDVQNWRDIVAISTGILHTVGLKADGTVIATGDSACGECDVQDWNSIAAVSASISQTIGLLTDGTVDLVGYCKDGQQDVHGWRGIVAVSAGKGHIAGLRADGTVAATMYVDDPEYDCGECNVQDWCNIVAISTGDLHTVGLKEDGTVVAVGSNSYGQCDVQTWSDIIAISAGRAHTVGLRADGTVVAVGYNYYGQCDVQDWDLW